VADALASLSIAEQRLLVGLLESVKSQLALMVEASGQDVRVDNGFDADERSSNDEHIEEATL
jgi:hypothetical protein